MKKENQEKLIELLKGMSTQEIRETKLIIEMVLLCFNVFDIKDKE